MSGGHGSPSLIPEHRRQKRDLKSKLHIQTSHAGKLCVQIRDIASMYMVESDWRRHWVSIFLHTHAHTCVYVPAHT